MRFKKCLIYNKSSNFTNPSLLQIEMIDIGHKSLPIIIGPYSCTRCTRAKANAFPVESYISKMPHGVWVSCRHSPITLQQGAIKGPFSNRYRN